MNGIHDALAILTDVGHALAMAFAMFWEILWPLILGFTISGVVQAVVSKQQMVQLLGDDRPATLARACGLGAASSSCSYAAVAIARSVFRKGANFTAAMAFELASTNLVLELAIIMIVFLGWQFALAELVGAPLMVIFLALLFRRFLSRRLVTEARAQAEKGVKGKMEGHAEMHMEVTEGRLWQRIWSERGKTAISHYFVMEWVSVWKDIAGGLLIAGALAAWVPRGFWQRFFLTSHPLVSTLWGPVVGPVVAILSFVCSVGNIPLAAVLWNGGISFGGVLAFIFADLIVLPILHIYRKYYGWRAMWFILGTFYLAMALASLVVELAFEALGLVPAQRTATVVETAITFDYTTMLDIIFLILAGVLVYRFFRTGGSEMLRMMNMSAQEMQQREQSEMAHG
ncbi:MAG TPA: permease [Gemmatimonadaceae bacterium]|nr:permease [Gemmatimonadaceae bacterium]